MVNEVDFRRFRQAFNVSVKKEFADDEMVSFVRHKYLLASFIGRYMITKEFVTDNCCR